jgi:omega-6 fatty acid desaturase (delta-12 desaturase)
VLDALLHRILQHPAHHLDMTIPFYRLQAAQQRLQELAPRQVQVRRLSWSYYWQVVRECKLYDYGNRRWLGYA